MGAAATAAPCYQLWKKDAHGRYLNIATRTSPNAMPEIHPGGILADDMV